MIVPPGSCLMEDPITHEKCAMFCNGWLNPEPGATAVKFSKEERNSRGDDFSTKDATWYFAVRFSGAATPRNTFTTCRVYWRKMPTGCVKFHLAWYRWACYRLFMVKSWWRVIWKDSIGILNDARRSGGWVDYEICRPSQGVNPICIMESK